MEIRALKFRVGHEWRVGGLYRPPASSLENAPAPAVLMLHGFPGLQQNEDVAAELCRRGMTVLMPRFCGCWGSGGEFAPRRLLADAHSALRLLRRYPGVDGHRVGVLGYSLGGWVALRLAAEASVKAVAALAPALPGPARDEDRRYLRRTARVVRADVGRTWDDYLAAAGDDDPRRYMRELSWTPLLLVHGLKDRLVPPEVSRKLMALAGQPKSLVELGDEDHEFQHDRPLVVELLAQWLERELQSKEEVIPEALYQTVDVGGGD
jgi:dipeptidyl aminopeptidase/acylaminoacyl peptidase